MPYTRPTTDIAKEGLFNIIHNNLDIEALTVLDLFGGTGCISYELASRGAVDITIVEKDNHMFDFIKKTAQDLSFTNFKVVRRMCLNLSNPLLVSMILFLPARLMHWQRLMIYQKK